ncbi:MAG: helix-turn-helix domain-containing protein [Thermomicrobium sp.]|nr:helix-turn-helix domain-containing protein [Thermomicrobium sp.]MDW8058549.1 helix-turn-helix domain-containing protein [Thermomicrobium sp.]
MTIHELAERAGVPPRRIRYYVARGLLPPPEGRGPTARYGPEHLRRLQLIRELRERRLGLDDIRERLQQHRGDAERECTLWYQWEIVPGVLLWTRADLPERDRGQVAVLVDVGRRLFRQNEGS